MTVSEASPGTPANGAPPSDRAFDYPGYRLYWVARFLLVFAIQVLSVSVGWQIYDQTRDPFLLGLVGLVQFLPAPILVLVTGSVADRFNRRIIMASCMAVEAVCALALLTILHQGLTAVWPVYAVLLVFGIARAFMGPAVQSLMANLVPQTALANAIALNSSSFQVATIIGPTAGGLLYGVSSELAYVVSILFFLSAGVLTLLIPKPEKRASQPVTTEALFAGFRYIWSQPIVLGALSLDMIAVMLGGAIALLPVFARDILDVGPWGLGALRSSVGVGALLMSLWLINNPVRDHAGLTMFAAVGRLWPRHHRLRHVDARLALRAGTRRHGRRRHGQRLHPSDAHSAEDARRPARPRERRQYDLYRRIERVGRISRRHHGRRLRRRSSCRDRRRGRSSDGGRVGAHVPRLAQRPPPRSDGLDYSGASGTPGASLARRIASVVFTLATFGTAVNSFRRKS